jgi:hypothetical protein
VLETLNQQNGESSSAVTDSSTGGATSRPDQSDGKSSCAIILLSVNEEKWWKAFSSLPTTKVSKKVAVQIDLERYGKLWEGIYDQLLAEERDHDKRLPYETVRRRLVRSRKLRG